MIWRLVWLVRYVSSDDAVQREPFFAFMFLHYHFTHRFPICCLPSQDEFAERDSGQPKAPPPRRTEMFDSNGDDDNNDSNTARTVATAEPNDKKPSARFADLDVPAEIARMFTLIDQYTPVHTTHPTQLKPFIPQYLPAVGVIDEFVKIPKPNRGVDQLGIVTLDEPSVHQSDKTSLSLQLRHVMKRQGVHVPVDALEGDLASGDSINRVSDPIHDPQKLTNWIDTVNRLHAGGGGISSGKKTSQQIQYSRTMPDVVELACKPWSGDEAQVLSTLKSSQTKLKQKAEVVCGAFDVPVYDSGNNNSAIIESLHLLFSAMLEVRSNANTNTLTVNK